MCERSGGGERVVADTYVLKQGVENPVGKLCIELGNRFSM